MCGVLRPCIVHTSLAIGRMDGARMSVRRLEGASCSVGQLDFTGCLTTMFVALSRQGTDHTIEKIIVMGPLDVETTLVCEAQESFQLEGEECYNWESRGTLQA